MGKQKKPKVGQAVAFEGAVATIGYVGKRREGGHWFIRLDTHKGRRYLHTDHAELHIP